MPGLAHKDTERGWLMAKDPVCGMQVDEGRAAARVEHLGVTYYFCSPGCHKAFMQQPAKYVPHAVPTRSGNPSAKS